MAYLLSQDIIAINQVPYLTAKGLLDEDVLNLALVGTFCSKHLN